MNTPHTLNEVLIVAVLVGAWVAWMYFRNGLRRRRLEIVHQERLAAMDKGIPLPELPMEPAPSAPDPNGILIVGVPFLALGLGFALTLSLMDITVQGRPVWPVALPLVLLGVGLILVHVLATRQSR